VFCFRIPIAANDGTQRYEYPSRRRHRTWPLYIPIPAASDGIMLAHLGKVLGIAELPAEFRSRACAKGFPAQRHHSTRQAVLSPLWTNLLAGTGSCVLGKDALTTDLSTAQMDGDQRDDRTRKAVGRADGRRRALRALPTGSPSAGGTSHLARGMKDTWDGGQAVEEGGSES
jgi:hypothetical protein